MRLIIIHTTTLLRMIAVSYRSESAVFSEGEVKTKDLEAALTQRLRFVDTIEITLYYRVILDDLLAGSKL